MARLSYEDSIRRLRERGLLDESEEPSAPSRMPQPDDDGPLGLSFFRTALEDEDLSDLSLPRTFFCRSLVARTSFRGSDLTESFLCWNDFARVDFSTAVLAGADLRAASFDDVSFAGANLSGADLRRSTFVRCDFAGAVLDEARLTAAGARNLGLTAAQRAAIAWQKDDGPEPAGG